MQNNPRTRGGVNSLPLVAVLQKLRNFHTSVESLNRCRGVPAVLQISVQMHVRQTQGIRHMRRLQVGVRSVSASQASELQFRVFVQV